MGRNRNKGGTMVFSYRNNKEMKIWPPATAEPLKLRINISRATALWCVAGDIFKITKLTATWTFFRWLCSLNGSAALPALPIRIASCHGDSPTGRITASAADCLYLAIIFTTLFTNTFFDLCHTVLPIPFYKTFTRSCQPSSFNIHC